jgi:hypothetical protein
MIKQISLIALAIGIGITTVLISGTSHVNGLVARQAPPVLSAGHDQIFSCGGICVTNGHDSINLIPQLQARPSPAF